MFQLGPSAEFVFKDVFAIGGALLHNNELAVVDVTEIFEIFYGPMVPGLDVSIPPAHRACFPDQHYSLLTTSSETLSSLVHA